MGGDIRVVPDIPELQLPRTYSYQLLYCQWFLFAVPIVYMCAPRRPQFSLFHLRPRCRPFLYRKTLVLLTLPRWRFLRFMNEPLLLTFPYTSLSQERRRGATVRGEAIRAVRLSQNTKFSYTKAIYAGEQRSQKS